MKNCPNCGAQVKEDAKFCRYCGGKLIQKQRPAPPVYPTEPAQEAAPIRERPKKPETPPLVQKAAAPIWEEPKEPETPPPVRPVSPIREVPKAPEMPPPVQRPLQPPPGGDAVRFCANCCSPLGKGDKFCTVCGRAVQGTTAQAPPRETGRNAKGWIIGIAAAVFVVALGALAYFFLAGGGTLPWNGKETQRLEEQLASNETGEPSTEEAAGQNDIRQPGLEEENADGQTSEAANLYPEQDHGEAATPPDTTDTQTPSEPVEETPEPWSKAEEIDFDHVTELVEGQAPNATWAYCVLDLENGLGYGTLNATEPLSASAMVIVPILYTLAAKMADGQLGMDTMVPITQNLGGRTQLSQQVGSSLRVDALAQYMLQYSDNIATNTLLEYLGFETVERVCAANGYESVSVANYVMATEDNTTNDNYVSASDLCAMLFELYHNENSAINGAFLEQYMHLQDDTEALGLLAQVPASVETMNLNGQKTGKYNEVALVQDGESIYAMAFLGHGDKLEALQSAAKEVGQYCIKTLELGE